MTSKAKLRRYLKRLAARKNITYQQAIELYFHGQPSKNIGYSLVKQRNKGKDRGKKHNDNLQRFGL